LSHDRGHKSRPRSRESRLHSDSQGRGSLSKSRSPHHYGYVPNDSSKLQAPTGVSLPCELLLA